MRVLWVCNIMLPVIARHLGLEASNKEGWLSGLADSILDRQQEHGIELAVAFPVEEEKDGYKDKIFLENGSSLTCYGFYEDIAHAEIYHRELEGKIDVILKDFAPDVIHCFGTEYGHAMAVTKVCERRERVLLGLQGLCSVCADAYMASLPRKVRKSVTLRDLLKKDNLYQQREKFAIRGMREIEAIKGAGNITGRTKWDHYYAKGWNPGAEYFTMNETLRSCFYEGQWDASKCEKGRIFISQGDYPLKGLHYMLLALADIRRHFPQVKVCVAGSSLVEDKTLKDRLKRSAYGRYLKQIIRKNHLKDHVEFLGRLSAQQMKEQYLKAEIFVCCSSLENSPNSLGEAMILGVPCISADVGGIPSLFRDGVDGLLYMGFSKDGRPPLEEIVLNLKSAVFKMLSNPERMAYYSKNARYHALETHDREANYSRLLEIYAEIARK